MPPPTPKKRLLPLRTAPPRARAPLKNGDWIRKRNICGNADLIDWAEKKAKKSRVSFSSLVMGLILYDHDYGLITLEQLTRLHR